jgi:protein-tyrosine kinase
VSLIESALEKLRRGREEGAPSPGMAPRALPAAPLSAPKVPALVVPSAPTYVRNRNSIDTPTLRRAGYLPEEGLERRFADHYRQIKRPLIEKALAGGPEMRLILVTSALPGDGKTFTSLNLAQSMARERDISVLLVDSDAPRARITEVLGLRGERGLLDALSDESVDVESLIVETDVRGLEILPAGKFVEGTTELFASTRMDQLAASLAARHPRRVVVFDSAPLLVSSEARAMVRVPGQVVLVVRIDVTPRQAALEAASYVDKKKLAGMIINHTPFKRGGGYYGYAGYGEGAAEASEDG